MRPTAALLLLALVPILLVGGFTDAASGDADPESRRRDAVEAYLAEHLDEFTALFEHLHRNPELSFHEVETAKRIGAELEAAGYEVTRGLGGEGLVGVLKNGAGPTVLIRTDMDALPITEATALPWASRVTTKDDAGQTVGVMHACGHDMHMTVFVATARALAARKADWRGTLLMVAQPAEERGAGARAMIADGVLARFGRPDHALALHMNAALPAGEVAFCEGYALANVDMVDLEILGEGGHGAYPHTTKDPIVAAAEIVTSLQTIVSREIAPTDPAVVTVGSIHGGTKHNIIPERVKLEITCRSYADAVREKILAAIDRKAKAVARGMGMPEDRLPVMTVRNESIPSTYNDPELTRRMSELARRTLGPARVKKAEPVMGGEDFGLFGRQDPRVPICLFWLGAVPREKFEAARKEGRGLPSLHSSTFELDPRPSAMTGARTMCALALDLLARP
ncbi:MAG: amidohydrolase [Planctomycetota bacterium]